MAGVLDGDWREVGEEEEECGCSEYCCEDERLCCRVRGRKWDVEGHEMEMKVVAMVMVLR